MAGFGHAVAARLPHVLAGLATLLSMGLTAQTLRLVAGGTDRDASLAGTPLGPLLRAPRHPGRATGGSRNGLDPCLRPPRHRRTRRHEATDCGGGGRRAASLPCDPLQDADRLLLPERAASRRTTARRACGVPALHARPVPVSTTPPLPCSRGDRHRPPSIGPRPRLRPLRDRRQGRPTSTGRDRARVVDRQPRPTGVRDPVLPHPAGGDRDRSCYGERPAPKRRRALSRPSSAASIWSPSC